MHTAATETLHPKHTLNMEKENKHQDRLFEAPDNNEPTLTSPTMVPWKDAGKSCNTWLAHPAIQEPVATSGYTRSLCVKASCV